MTELETPQVSASIVVQAIGLGEIPLADLVAQVGETAIAAAWARGEIEFGHRAYVVGGAAGAPDSELIIEVNDEWSGPKTASHSQFRSSTFLAEIPTAGKYTMADKFADAIYTPSPHHVGIPIKVRAPIPRAEAEQLLAHRVRLTDKGVVSYVGA